MVAGVGGIEISEAFRRRPCVNLNFYTVKIEWQAGRAGSLQKSAGPSWNLSSAGSLIASYR